MYANSPEASAGSLKYAAVIASAYRSSALRGDPAVSALHTTNGRWDIVAELRADTLEEFDRVLGRIRRIEGVATSETNLLLSTLKY